MAKHEKPDVRIRPLLGTNGVVIEYRSRIMMTAGSQRMEIQDLSNPMSESEILQLNIGTLLLHISLKDLQIPGDIRAEISGKEEGLLRENGGNAADATLRAILQVVAEGVFGDEGLSYSLS